MREDSAISCQGITKYYPLPMSLKSLLIPRTHRRREKLVLDKVRFEANRGEIFGLVGPNGAGKTTIVKVLSHLTSPSSGRAFVCGFDVERQWNSAMQYIGYCVSEERSFFWRLTGRQNLQFFADLLEVPVTTARSRIAELIEMLELADVADDRFMNYSSGMKQKMAIARSLLADPKILLMDEPTRGLDPRAALRLRSFIREYVSRDDRTAVVTTNQVSDIENLCHRIAIINHGRIIALGALPEIRSSVCEKLHTAEEMSFERVFSLVLEGDDLARAGEKS